MKGFHSLVTVSIVLEKLFEILPHPKPEVEECGLSEALNRVLAEDLVCPFDVPQFDRSAVDGYAIKAVDTISSSPTNPLEFRVVGKVIAGSKPGEIGEVIRGESALIFTGAPMPSGTDSVVMVEHCDRIDGVVRIRHQVHPLQNVSRKGEDFRENETMITAGTILKPWHISAIASVGRSIIGVRRKLHIGVLSTGSEIVEPGGILRLGQVANSTKPLLLAFINQRGCKEIDLGTVPDNLDDISASIAKSWQECDIILTTGGSSVGEKDLVFKAISNISGSTSVAHGVRIRPGRPTGVSVLNGKPVFTLSGFPVAAMTAFQALIAPTISYLLNAEEELVPWVTGVLTRRISNETGNRSYVRVRVFSGANGLEVDPLILTGSGLISTLTKSNGLLVLNESLEGYDEGEKVEVMLTGNISTRRPPDEILSSVNSFFPGGSRS